MDFVVSAVAVGEILARAEQTGVGRAAWEAIHATRQVTTTNTNLGIVLLLAPLAAVPRKVDLPTGIAQVLRSLTAEDAVFVYKAIRAAGSRSLGRVEQWDVAGEPPTNLLAAMELAAPCDLVARQYVSDYAMIFRQALPWLLECLDRKWRLTDAVIHTFLRLLATYPDSLVVRKAGESTAKEVSLRAAHLLEKTSPSDSGYEQALADFDFWLRSDGHRRNPGTTADLIAATLFAGLREGLIVPPWR